MLTYFSGKLSCPCFWNTPTFLTSLSTLLNPLCGLLSSLISLPQHHCSLAFYPSTHHPPQVWPEWWWHPDTCLGVHLSPNCTLTCLCTHISAGWVDTCCQPHPLWPVSCPDADLLRSLPVENPSMTLPCSGTRTSLPPTSRCDPPEFRIPNLPAQWGGQGLLPTHSSLKLGAFKKLPLRLMGMLPLEVFASSRFHPLPT